MRRISLLYLTVLLSIPLQAGRWDPFERIAAKLTAKAAPKLREKKIAVLPFEHLSRPDSPGGRVVAEKITNRLVELGEVTVVERGLVEKVVKELEFQLSGAVDPDAARELGKGLGVEAIITGTLQEDKMGRIEINARMIETESYEILAAVVEKVEKTWRDNPGPAAQAPGPVPAQHPMQWLSSGEGEGFFDVFIGLGWGKTDLALQSNFSIINRSDTGLAGIVPVTFRSANFENLDTKAALAYGLRIGRTKSILGAAAEISLFEQAVKSQSVSYRIDGADRGTVAIPADYLKIRVLNLLSGDVFLRVPVHEDIYPYLGAGLGLTLNHVRSSALRSPFGGPIDENRLGFIYRFPAIGVRARLSERGRAFVEYRRFYNTFSFERGTFKRKDTIGMKGDQLLSGLVLTF